MIVRELLDKLNIKEEDVIQIGENSYSRNELYSLPKNELIFDKEVSEIYNVTARKPMVFRPWDEWR